MSRSVLSHRRGRGGEGDVEDGAVGSSGGGAGYAGDGEDARSFFVSTTGEKGLEAGGDGGGGVVEETGGEVEDGPVVMQRGEEDDEGGHGNRHEPPQSRRVDEQVVADAPAVVASARVSEPPRVQQIAGIIVINVTGLVPTRHRRKKVSAPKRPLRIRLPTPPPSPRQMQRPVHRRRSDRQPPGPSVHHRRSGGRPAREPHEGAVPRDGQEEVREAEEREDGAVVGHVDEEPAEVLVGHVPFHVSPDVATEEEQTRNEDERRGEFRRIRDEGGDGASHRLGLGSRSSPPFRGVATVSGSFVIAIVIVILMPPPPGQQQDGRPSGDPRGNRQRRQNREPADGVLVALPPQDRRGHVAEPLAAAARAPVVEVELEQAQGLEDEETEEEQAVLLELLEDCLGKGRSGVVFGFE
ncbi:hypothetical protein ACHAXS_005854 [Conticribra weissflogii]